MEFLMPFRSRPLTGAVAATVLAVTLAVTLGACGDSEDPKASPTPTTSTPATSTSPTPTPTPTPEDTVIELTIGDAQPGRRVEVAVGEKVVLRVTATQAGELHVHSSPEQELEFPAGTTDLILVIDQPGIVDVEDHGSETLLVQLEVR